MLVIDVLKSLIKKEKYSPYHIRKGSARFNKANNQCISVDEKEIIPEVKNDNIINLFNNKNHSFKLKFNDNSNEFIIDHNKTIIENAEDNGIELKYSCLSGGCGSCKIKKIKGKVEMSSTNCLSDNEIDEDYILACISYPLSDLILEI